MDDGDPAGSDITWLMPASLLAIGLSTAVGVGAPYVVGRSILEDASVATLSFVVFLLLAVVDHVVPRFIVLPGQIRAYREPLREAVRPTYEETAAAMTIVSFAAPVSTPFLGVAAAILAGQGLLMLPFPAIAVISHVSVSGYLRESLEALRRDISVDGGA